MTASTTSAYPDEAIAQQVAAQLPWGHLIRLLDTVPNPDARTWYARQTIQYGWSRAILAHQIEARLYERQGRTRERLTL